MIISMVDTCSSLAAKRFNLNKSEANKVLTTLSANGYF